MDVTWSVSGDALRRLLQTWSVYIEDSVCLLDDVIVVVSLYADLIRKKRVAGSG